MRQSSYSPASSPSGTAGGEDNAQEEAEEKNGEDKEKHPKPTVSQLRDRALIAVMVFSLARVSATLAMKVEDYYTEGRRAWFRLHETGGNRHKVPAHHNAEKYVDAYLDAAAVAGQKKTPLFRSIDTHRRLTDRPMDRNDALPMIKRRAKAAGLSEDTCRHTFRATGIAAYLENGGTIERAQQIANRESQKTTKLYDRTSDQITLDEVEEIVIRKLPTTPKLGAALAQEVDHSLRHWAQLLTRLNMLGLFTSPAC